MRVWRITRQRIHLGMNLLNWLRFSCCSFPLFPFSHFEVLKKEWRNKSGDLSGTIPRSPSTRLNVWSRNASHLSVVIVYGYGEEDTYSKRGDLVQ